MVLLIDTEYDSLNFVNNARRDAAPKIIRGLI